LVDVEPAASEITVTGTRQREAWRRKALPPVEQVRPGLWTVPTIFPNHPLRYVLTYAVAYGNGVALVDTGWPCDAAWDDLLGGLREAGWEIGDVKAVLVTHAHPDHVGLARRIREQTGAWVGMHEADARMQRLYRPRPGSGDSWLRQRGAQANDIQSVSRPRSEMFDDFALDPDRLITDGERPLGRSSPLRAVWTPGHTPGHLCFYEPDLNVLLTGDHLLPRITPNISPVPGEDADVLGDYLSSLLLLTAYAPDEVLPAHEYRFAGLAARVGQLRHHHERRLAETLQVLRGSPGVSTVEVAEELSWSRDWAQMHGMIRRSAVGETYAHLIHLERTGYVVNKGAATDTVDAWYVISDQLPRLT
jgi:glyoxylase-like metal-dependent hydrolase (beta-lactamase superfamily II)